MIYKDSLVKFIAGCVVGVVLTTGSILMLTQQSLQSITPLSYQTETRDVIRRSNNTTEEDNLDDTVAQRLYRDVRVVCWVMTYPRNLWTKARAVKNTWGKRCNVVLYMSDAPDEKFPAIGLKVEPGRKNLVFKTIKAFEYVYKHHLADADWFMKADDDTYVVMENLRYLLSNYDPQTPVYLGRPFKMYLKQGYMSGGAGYVLSKEALRMFVEKGSKDCHINGIAEDLYVGRCMETLGIHSFDARDKFGHTRFHIKDPRFHLLPEIDNGYSMWDAYNGITGVNNISDYAISFHYVTPSMMSQLEYYVYHLRPYGILPGLPNINGPIKTILVKPGRFGMTAK